MNKEQLNLINDVADRLESIENVLKRFREKENVIDSWTGRFISPETKEAIRNLVIRDLELELRVTSLEFKVL